MPDRHEARYLSEVSQGVGEAAIDAVKRETSLLISRALRLSMNAFDPPLPVPPGHPPVRHRRGMKSLKTASFNDLYVATKTLEGEILEFTIRLQSHTMPPEDSARLTRYLNASRHAVHCAKAMKDIRHNLVELSRANEARVHEYAHLSRDSMSAFLTAVYTLRPEQQPAVSFEGLADLLHAVEQRHSDFHDRIYTDVREQSIDEQQVSTLLNVNRELLTAQRSLTLALGEYHLDRTRFEDLERLPL